VWAFGPTPCLADGSAGRRAGGGLGSQNQAITKDTKSTVEAIPLRSEIEEKKKKNKQPNNQVVLEMVMRTNEASA
jgi:hypothetical protein